MKTMEKLIARFNKMHPDYSAELVDYESRPGWYVVFITNDYFTVSARYYFSSCKDFRGWMDGVVLD